MSAWILYILVVSTLLSVAGWIAEHAARLGRKSTRWIWLACIITSLLIPAIVSSVSIQLPNFDTSVNVAEHIIVLRNQTIAALSPNTWVHRAVASNTLHNWDQIVREVWIGLSSLMVVLLVASAIALARRKRQWTWENFAGVGVYLSDHAGPAVVGLFNPRIVIPRWIIDSENINKATVIAHEQSHLHAGDQRLLTIAVCLLVFMPWNFSLWWQLKRLRHAIEVDCDARVLRNGHEPSAYGETLIEVGQRQSTFVGMVAAMSESTSFLEQRINIMMHKPVWFHYAIAMLLTLASLGVASAATQISPPTVGGQSLSVHTEIKLPITVLDRYVGSYKFYEMSILTISRKDELMYEQQSGLPPVEIFPESKKTFFMKVVDAQITFDIDSGGTATALTLHQNGKDFHMLRIDAVDAEQIQNALATKVRAQLPNPNSEFALHRIIADIESGSPTYAGMTPELAEATRQQLPAIRDRLAMLGVVSSIEFRGVGEQGWDVYEVHHEHGMSMVRMYLDPNGTVTGILFTAGP